MAAVSSIVLPDAQGTPVNHTFVPLGPSSDGTWWFEDQSGSSPVAYARIGSRLSRTPAATNGQSSSSDRVNRVVLTLSLPQVETLGTNDAGITPPPTVAFVDRFKVEFVMAERDSLQNRKDLRKYLLGLLANTQILDQIESLQSIY